MNIGNPRSHVTISILTYFVKTSFEPNVTHFIQGRSVTNSVKRYVTNISTPP